MALKSAQRRTATPARKARRETSAPTAAPDVESGTWWRLALVVLAVCLAYSNSLSGPFIMDDSLSIVDNPQIRDLSRLGRVLSPARELPTAGRPLVNLSFAVNYALGGLAVRGYHVVNVGLHAVCALLVFGIVRRTLELPGVANILTGRPKNLGLAAALLWALHPLNTEAVDYLTQRTELSMALCYLFTLYAAIRAWPDEDVRWRATAVMACAAGMACKESMATAPVMIVIYDAVFLFGSLAAAVRKRWPFYAWLAMPWILLAALMSSGPRLHSAGFSSGASPWTYLLDQTVMITRYLRLSMWPRDLVVNYGRPFDTTLVDVLPYALFIASLLAATIATIAWRPKLGFLGAWFFVTLAPASSIVPIATQVGAERRMYLPLIALVVLAVVGTSLIKRVGTAVAAAALLVTSAALAAATFSRNDEYTSRIRLARTVIERQPNSVGHFWLATLLFESSQRDEGMTHLLQAVPGEPRARYVLGLQLFKDGEMQKAVEQLQTFLGAYPYLIEAVDARQVLGRAYANQQRWPEAIAQYRQVLSMNPSAEQRVETQGLLADALFATQSYNEAAVNYASYLRGHPSDAAALNNLGISFIVIERLDDAIAVFRRAVRIAPNDDASHRNLANALFDHRDLDEAAEHAHAAVTLQSSDPASHELLGRILAVQGRLGEARDEFERALSIDPVNEDAKEDLVKLRRLETGR